MQQFAPVVTTSNNLWLAKLFSNILINIVCSGVGRGKQAANQSQDDVSHT